MSDIDISVVIPVKNGEKYLDSMLKSVFSQDVNFKFEVIIVDSGSKDKTLDTIKKYPVILYQIKEEDFNHGLTRNFGISKASGRYVILMTQDTIPCDKHWMEKLINNLECDYRVAGTYSRQVPHEDAAAFSRLKTSMFFTSQREKRVSYIDNMRDYERLSPAERHRFCNFDNVSSCIRKSVWENFRFPSAEFGEDLEWAKRILEAGYKIIYEPDSAVYHSHDYSIAGWYKRNRINHNKLHSILGLNDMDAAYKLLPFFFIYAIKNFYGLAKFYKDKGDIKAVFSNICLIPLYSFSAALGQYIGIKESKGIIKKIKEDAKETEKKYNTSIC
jgi:rhamnosyltransferase